MGLLAQSAQQKFESATFESDALKRWIVRYFYNLEQTADTLRSIARKELDGHSLDPPERTFLEKLLFAHPGVCGDEFNGWYPRLFYADGALVMKKDLVVADVHTAPTDEWGSPVGYVMHAGTGPINLAIVVSDLPGEGSVSFVGPVMSYYEHVSVNFKRLTDEEWQDAYAIEPSFRPDFVNIYLANRDGGTRGDGPSLLTSVPIQDPSSSTVPAALQLAQNYPNPFNASTIIGFSIPQRLASKQAELTVYDVRGQVVSRLLRQALPAGNYVVRWNGTADNGAAVASGIYLYRLKVGEQQRVGKMSLIK